MRAPFQHTSTRRSVRNVLITFLLLLPASAHATYSIAATDSKSKQVGGGITSCVGALDVGIVYGGVPGHGVVHAQATLDPNAKGKNFAMQQLGMDTPPLTIVMTLQSSAFDTGAQSRQYGLVDLQGRSSGFTGTNAQAYKEDRQGKIDTFTYSVQGNILTSKKVLDQAQAAFEGGGCDLADRLMRALEGGAMNGEGDSRCTTTKNTPSDSAFLEVDDPTGPPYLKISVTKTGTQSAVVALRQQYDTWRQTHPCPSPSMPDAGAPMMDASPFSDASSDGGMDPVKSGGCSTAPSDPSSAWVILLALAAHVRSRRNARSARSAMP